MFAAALVPADNALNIWRFISLGASGLGTVGLAPGSGAGGQRVPGGENVPHGDQTGDVFGGGGGRQVRRGHRRRAYLERLPRVISGESRGPGVPRGPRGWRGHQRHRGGGAAGREPQLQRAGELGVMMSRWHATRKQARRRGRIHHPGSRQGRVRSSDTGPRLFLRPTRDRLPTEATPDTDPGAPPPQPYGSTSSGSVSRGCLGCHGDRGWGRVQGAPRCSSHWLTVLGPPFPFTCAEHYPCSCLQSTHLL
ncbi:hypothetical protein KQX54_002054 [Cotesia glomerata]|uniref:Uncharacterized protein n=1 Tax=Cotesia glomerata TaxID=32391 RepID=A0AAV7HGF5_COTGL|nr:hypothetical protein KQX54_002054 [Cotesia glomerata]